MSSISQQNNALAQRIRDAHAARKEQSEADHADSLAAADLAGGGIFLETVRRSTLGVDPQWLVRAKVLHEALGRYLYVLSRRSTMNLPPEVMQLAEREVRRFVDGMPGEVEHERYDATVLLVVTDLVARRDESIKLPLEAGMPPAEAFCFSYSIHDLEIATRLAGHVDLIALLLDRWDDDTPRRPTKWNVAADLWEKATGKRYEPTTWRRWDPRKKQALPGSKRARAKKPR